MEPEPPFLPGAGADPIWSEPESAPGPRTAGAAQKSGGSATLLLKNILHFFSKFSICVKRLGFKYNVFGSTTLAPPRGYNTVSQCGGSGA